MAVSEADAKPSPAIEDLERDYADVLFIAQMERTPEAWVRAGAAWGHYFDALMASDAEAHHERKVALADRVRRARGRVS